ncbi:hypothetical protein [Pinisolibacter sp.]|uniref:hypothetical protein n=1 Tax=Pinisolibacter sp. TaxID=2172024 RepID=UPI002FDC7DC8
MSAIAETVQVMESGMGQAVAETAGGQVHKVRVSRRDRRMVRTALGIMAVLATLDAVLYLGRFI